MNPTNLAPRDPAPALSDPVATGGALPVGVRLRMALDVIEPLAELDAPVVPRTAKSRMRLARVRVDAGGFARITGDGDASGAAEVVCEILAGRDAPEALDALDDVPDGVKSLLARALDEHVARSTAELAIALSEAGRGLIETHEEVRRSVHAAAAARATEKRGDDELLDDLELPPVSAMLASFKATRLGLFGVAIGRPRTVADDDAFDVKQTTLFRRRLPVLLEPLPEPEEKVVIALDLPPDPARSRRVVPRLEAATTVIPRQIVKVRSSRRDRRELVVVCLAMGLILLTLTLLLFAARV